MAQFACTVVPVNFSRRFNAKGLFEPSPLCHTFSMKILLPLFTLVLGTAAFSATEYQILILEKNFKFDDIIVMNAYLDENCRFIEDPENKETPKTHTFWMIDRKTPRELKPVYMKKMNEIMRFESTHDPHHIVMRALDIGKIEHDLPEAVMDVESRMLENGECALTNELQLGPKHGSQLIRVESLYAKVKTFLGIPVKADEVVLSGTILDGGEKGQEIKAHYFSM